LLVIAENALGATNVAATAALTNFVERGGRVLVLRQPMRKSAPYKNEQETFAMNASNKLVHIELSQPVTVAMAPPEVQKWGPYQFPGLARLPDGRIQLSFHVEADSATAYGLPPARAVSADEGKTWTLMPREATTDGASTAWDVSVLLPNGDRLQVKTLRPRKASELRLPEKPFAQYVSYGIGNAIYRVEDLPAECAAGWMLQRLPAGKTQWQEERATVRLPGEVRTVAEGVMWFPWLAPQMVVAPDGALWAVNYTLRRVVNGRYQEKCPVTVLRSADAGRSWDIWSEIPYAGNAAADPKADNRDGFTEPYVGFMPDGSALMLLRTTDGNGPGPLYGSRSTDGGKTWSPPAVFDDLGVWPQMLTLKNGVTLAVYGRPGLYVRATADPAGLQWDKRITVIEPAQLHTETCSYAALLPLNDHTALMAYSNFKLCNSDGKQCKGIQVREVTVRSTHRGLRKDGP
jgi:hypothetical protein